MLQNRLLHDDMKESGLLPVLARQMREYNHRHQPRSHAADLAEAVHIVLRMLDRLNRSGLARRISPVSVFGPVAVLCRACLQLLGKDKNDSRCPCVGCTGRGWRVLGKAEAAHPEASAKGSSANTSAAWC